MKKNKVCIVDDHTLLTNALAGVINQFEDFEVAFSAENGEDFIQKLKTQLSLPDIVLLDLNMPVMDGYETLDWIRENHPDLKVIILTMNDDEPNIIKALRKGASSYLLKNVSPNTLKEAFIQIIEKGVYHNDLVNKALLSSIQHKNKEIDFKPYELTFLKLICTEMTYKEIAEKMHLSPKTIDGYRQQLFEKLNVKSRVGLVMFALQNNIVDKD